MCLSTLFLHPPFFSFCLSLTVCPSLPPCSLCVVLISDRFCSIPSVELKQQHKIQRKKENTLVNTTPQTFPFFFFDVFHLISLIYHLPLTKSIDSVSEPVCFFFFCLDAFGWQLQKLSLTRKEKDGRILPHIHYLE